MANSYEILLKIGGALSNSLRSSISSVSKSLQGVEKATEKTSKGFNPLQAAADKTSKGFGALKGVLLGAAGALGVTVGFGAIIDAASKTQDANKQLQTVLKSTGGAAGVTQQAAESLASSLGSVTTFGRNAVLGSENLLLTFTKIGKDVMPQATETVLNMSQALGQDTKSSAIQLGKALNDPLTGMTALQRVGVTFSAQQKKQIELMQKSGNVMGAQKIILAELNTEFGGSARAAAQTFSGQMTIAKNAVTGAMGQIGIAILPTIQSVLPSLTAGVREFANFVTAHQGDIKNAVSSIGPAFNEAITVVKTYLMPAVSDAFQYIKDSIPSVKGVIQDLKPAFMGIVDAVQNNLLPIISNGFKISGAAIKTAAGVVKVLGDNLNIVIPIIEGVTAGFVAYNAVLLINNAAQKTGLIIQTLTKAWGTAAAALSLLREGESLAAVAQLVLNGTMLANPAVLMALEIGVAIGVLIGIGMLLYKNWGSISKFLLGVWNDLKTVSGNVFGAIGKFITTSWTTITVATQNVWKGITDWLSTSWNNIKTTALGVFNILPAGIQAPLNAIFSNIKTIIGSIQTVFNGVIEFVTGVFTGNWQKAWEGVKNVFTGVFTGLGAILKVPINEVIGLINMAIDGIDSLHINIPKGIPVIGGQAIGFSIPHIPQLANGGIIQHRPGGIMANIGEGNYDEAVVPLKPGGSGIGGGAGQIIWSPQITIQGNASKDDVKRALDESQRDFEQKMKIYEANKKRVSFAP